MDWRLTRPGDEPPTILHALEVGRPNGLAFSPDESKLYVVEAAATPRVIRVLDVDGATGRLSNNRVFFRCQDGETPDGFRVDVDGNL